METINCLHLESRKHWCFSGRRLRLAQDTAVARLRPNRGVRREAEQRDATLHQLEQRLRDPPRHMAVEVEPVAKPVVRDALEEVVDELRGKLLRHRAVLRDEDLHARRLGVRAAGLSLVDVIALEVREMRVLGTGSRVDDKRRRPQLLVRADCHDQGDVKGIFVAEGDLKDAVEAIVLERDGGDHLGSENASAE